MFCFLGIDGDCTPEKTDLSRGTIALQWEKERKRERVLRVSDPRNAFTIFEAHTVFVELHSWRAYSRSWDIQFQFCYIQIPSFCLEAAKHACHTNYHTHLTFAFMSTLQETIFRQSQCPDKNFIWSPLKAKNVPRADAFKTCQLSFYNPYQNSTGELYSLPFTLMCIKAYHVY